MIEIPHDLDAERAVIGALLLAGSAGETARGHEVLDVEDFHDQRLRTIFCAILDIEASGKHTDPISVGVELRRVDKLEDAGGRQHLAALEASVASWANVGHWAEVLVEVGKHRQAAIVLATATAGFDADPDAATDRLVAALSGITAKESDQTSQGFSAEGYRAVMLARAEAPFGLSTGLPSFDRVIQGLGPGMVHIIAARPSCGKSALAIAIARHVGIAQRRPVLIISMEMSREKIDDRVMAAESGIPASLSKHARMDLQQRAHFQSTIERLDGAPIAIVDKGSPTVRELAGLARQWASRNPDYALIIIDYLQLATGRGDNREQEVASISRCCKAISVDLHVPVIALSQLNRAVKPGEVPGLHHLRESGSLEQDADTVTFIHFDGPPSETDVAELIIAKNRDGACGKTRIGWDAPCVRFYELD